MKVQVIGILYVVCAFVLLVTLQSDSFRFLSRKNLQQSTRISTADTSSSSSIILNASPSVSASVSEPASAPRGRQKKIAVGLCATAKGARMRGVSLTHMALMRFAVPSLVKTMEKDVYEYELYIGIDDDDTFWSNVDNQRRVQAAAGDALKVVFKAFPNKKNRVPFNKIMKAALDGGADYFVRINDDSEFITGGWTSQGIATLLSYDPPNIGVVGPTCKQGNTNIMTHDMVYKTHFKIFNNQYYPNVFDNWWVDDWITSVYGQNRTKKLKSWAVHHHTKHHRTRYNVNYNLRKQLSLELEKGRNMVAAYLYSTTCQLRSDVPFTEPSGIDKGLFEQVYNKKGRVACEGIFLEVTDRPGSRFASSLFFEQALKWKSLLVAPDAEDYKRLKEQRPKASVFQAKLGKTSLPWSSSSTLKEVFQKAEVKHVDVMVLDVINAEKVLAVMDWSVKVNYLVVKFDWDSNPLHSQVSKLLYDNGYVAAQWNWKQWCPSKDCVDHLVFIHPAITVVVLTMNRVNSLTRLLNSLESAEYGTDPIALEIKVDHSSAKMHTSAIAKSFRFSHGPVKVTVSEKNKGLALSWFEAWQPHDETSLGIILEDDIEVAPTWYKWIKGAWGTYLHRKDIGGVTLQRQVLIPVRPPIQREIVNGHKPFLYSLVGSIGFAPHPVWWIKFTEWIRSVNFMTVDVATPELVTSHWWKHGKKKHMWTQHFIHFSKKHDLSTLYINLPGGQTLGAHWREKGQHSGSTLGKDYPLATDQEVNTFPQHLVKYGFNGLPSSKLPGQTCIQTFQRNQDSGRESWATTPGVDLLVQKSIGEALCSLVNSSVNVVEWGTSALTLFFGELAHRWDSVAHDDKGFFEMKRRLAVFPNVNASLMKHSWNGIGDGSYEQFKEYVDLPKGLRTKYDVAVINGRARVDCAWSLLNGNLLTTNARVLIFDWMRQQYKEVLTQFEVVQEFPNARPSFAILRVRSPESNER